MSQRLVIPFQVPPDFEAGEYELYAMEPCSSLDCGGEYRPVEYDSDGAYRCLACGMWREPC